MDVGVVMKFIVWYHLLPGPGITAGCVVGVVGLTEAVALAAEDRFIFV